MDLKTFEFNKVNLRAIVEDTEPWFVAKDVCAVLGTRTANLSAILDPEEHQKVYSIDNLKDIEGLPKDTILINESGLYSLILKSRKPEAKAFKKWVTSVVLPAIRKTGGYIQGEENAQSEMELILRGYQMLMNKVELFRKSQEEDVSVDFYRAFYLREYLAKSDKIALGKKATLVCKQKGWEVNKAPKIYQGRPTTINLYPKKALDIAVKLLWGDQEIYNPLFQ